MKEAGAVLDVTTGDEVRGAVLAALETLVPPRTVREAELLGTCGPVVLDILPEPAQLTTEQVPLVLRTLVKVGG